MDLQKSVVNSDGWLLYFTASKKTYFESGTLIYSSARAKKKRFLE